MNGTGRAWLGDVRVGVAVYLVTSLPVFLGVQGQYPAIEHSARSPISSTPPLRWRAL